MQSAARARRTARGRDNASLQSVDGSAASGTNSTKRSRLTVVALNVASSVAPAASSVASAPRNKHVLTRIFESGIIGPDLKDMLVDPQTRGDGQRRCFIAVKFEQNSRILNQKDTVYEIQSDVDNEDVQLDSKTGRLDPESIRLRLEQTLKTRQLTQQLKQFSLAPSPNIPLCTTDVFCKGLCKIFDKLAQTSYSGRPHDDLCNCFSCEPCTRGIGIWIKLTREYLCINVEDSYQNFYFIRSRLPKNENNGREETPESLRAGILARETPLVQDKTHDKLQVANFSSNIFERYLAGHYMSGDLRTWFRNERSRNVWWPQAQGPKRIGLTIWTE